jgi:hypothetical protein
MGLSARAPTPPPPNPARHSDHYPTTGPDPRCQRLHPCHDPPAQQPHHQPTTARNQSACRTRHSSQSSSWHRTGGVRMMCREAACVPFCPRGFSSWSVLLRQSPHPPPALCLLEKLNPLPPCILHFHHCIPLWFQFEFTRLFSSSRRTMPFRASERTEPTSLT